MTDAAKVEETKPAEKTPEQLAQEEAQKRMQEEQQQIAATERSIANGKRQVTVLCLNLVQAAMQVMMPNPEAPDGPRNKKNPQKRVATPQDFERLSVVIGHLTQSVANLSSGGGMVGPMGPRGMMGR